MSLRTPPPSRRVRTTDAASKSKTTGINLPSVRVLGSLSKIFWDAAAGICTPFSRESIHEIGHLCWAVETLETLTVNKLEERYCLEGIEQRPRVRGVQTPLAMKVTSFHPSGLSHEALLNWRNNQITPTRLQ